MNKQRRGLWVNQEGTREGKYLVVRRDGTIPDWPHFVIAAADPAAPAALREYAAEADRRGFDKAYVNDVFDLATKFEAWRAMHDEGDPDAPKHRTDNPDVIEWMRHGGSVGYQQKEKNG